MENSTGTARGNSRKKYLLLLLKAAVSSSLLYLILRKAGLANVLNLIRGINPLVFLAAALIYIISIFVSTFRWRLLVPIKLPHGKLFSLYLIGSFFNHILPGLVGGDAVKGYYYYKETGKASEGVASIFMERYLGFVSLLTIASLAYPLGLPYLDKSGLAWFLPTFLACFIVGSLLFFTLKVGSRIKHVRDFYGYFRMYGKKTLFKGLLISFAVQGFAIITVYVLSLGFGFQVPLALFFIFVPLINTFAAVPLSISGLGIREASFVLFFGSVGVSPEAATALSLAWYLSLVAGSIAGLFVYLRIK